MAFETVLMNEVACTVIYVDPTATGANTGENPTDARTTFPAMAGIVSGTIFLIRRGTGSTGVSLPGGNTTSGARAVRTDLNNVYFIGMPKSTDWLYYRMPAAAKAAWDADAADYARVEFPVYNPILCMYPIQHAGVHRCWFVRMSPASGFSWPQAEGPHNGFDEAPSTNYSSPNSLHFSGHPTIGNAMYNEGNYFFTNNRWSDNGIDLTNSGWTTNSTTLGATMAFRRGRNMTFRDNIIEFNQSYNTASGTNWDTQIYMCMIEHFETLDMCNNTFWVTSAAWYNGGRTGQVTHLYNIENITFINNTVKLIPQNYTNVSFAMPIWIEQFKTGTIKDVAVSIARYYNTGTPTTGYIYYHCVYINYWQQGAMTDMVNKVTIKNISSNTGRLFNYGPNDTNACNVYIQCGLNNGGSDQVPGPYTVDVSNITATCVDGVVGVSPGFGSAAGTALNLLLLRNANTVTNITAEHYQATGLRVGYGDYGAMGPVYKNVAVKGYLWAYHVPFMEITTITSPNVGMQLNIYGSVVYIGTATYNKASWAAQAWLSYNYASWSHAPQVFIDNINLPVYSGATSLITWNATPDAINNASYPVTHDTTSGIWLNNVSEITGNWFGSNRYYQGTTHSTARSGGGAASIKFTSQVYNSNSRIPLHIGPTNFKGLQWTPPATGNAYAKFYLAHVNTVSAYYLPAELDIAWVSKRIRGEVWVPYLDGDGVVRYRIYASNVSGIWETDAISSWTPGEALVQRVCTIPFLVTTLVDGGATATPVQFRLRYDLYGATGYTYFDPVIVFSMS